MNEWLKRLVEQVKTLWGKWGTTQKILLFAILGAALLSIILLIAFSSRPSMVPLLTSPVADEELRSRISARLDEENVPHAITNDGSNRRGIVSK